MAAVDFCCFSVVPDWQVMGSTERCCCSIGPEISDLNPARLASEPEDYRIMPRISYRRLLKS